MNSPLSLTCFFNFLRQEAIRAEAIYILGDLFEAWIGNDYVEPALAPVIDALAALTNAGVPVIIMAGDRDFSRVNS